MEDFQETFSYRTRSELEELKFKKEKEIELIEEELKKHNEISEIAKKLKEEIKQVLSTNKLPYILIKEKYANKFTVLKTSGLKVTASKKSDGEFINLVSVEGGAELTYGFGSKCRFFLWDKDFTYSRYSKLDNDLVKDIKNGFIDNEKLRNFLIHGLNDEISADYYDKKKKLNSIFPIHYHSFVTVTDTDGTHECKDIR